MTHIPKPPVRHPALPLNSLGFTRRDYEGSMSTLCAGCGHDSVTAAIIEAAWEMDLEPHRVAKLSGIGCSSKTPTYFLGQSHGFNSVHGRMPAIASGASAGNRGLLYLGVSGDGDSLSIGLGQLCHAIRRNVDMLYVLENNGVYGLTKGQFSASADVGSRAKRGEVNRSGPIDPVLLALTLGAGFVARGFSGDKAELIPLLKAGLHHRGFALVDVVSPCVAFNDHEGSTKSYRFSRKHLAHAVEMELEVGGLPPGAGWEGPPATLGNGRGGLRSVPMQDGSAVHFRTLPPDYDPGDRARAYRYVQERQGAGEVPTGLLHLDPSAPAMHEALGTVETPLVDLPFESLCPGAAELDTLLAEWR